MPVQKKVWKLIGCNYIYIYSKSDGKQKKVVLWLLYLIKKIKIMQPKFEFRGTYDKFPDFFVWTFKTGVDS